MAAGARFSYARAVKVAGSFPNDVHSQTPSLLLARRGCTRPPDPTRTTIILREFPFPPFSPFWKIESGLIAYGIFARCHAAHYLRWRDVLRGGGSFTYDVLGIFPAGPPTDKRSTTALCAQASGMRRLCAHNCNWAITKLDRNIYAGVLRRCDSF